MQCWGPLTCSALCGQAGVHGDSGAQVGAWGGGPQVKWPLQPQPGLGTLERIPGLGQVELLIRL